MLQLTISSPSKNEIQGGSNMTGTNCDLYTHKSSRSYLNHLVYNRVSALQKSSVTTACNVVQKFI
jgi:hypothetical protein